MPGFPGGYLLGHWEINRTSVLLVPVHAVRIVLKDTAIQEKQL